MGYLTHTLRSLLRARGYSLLSIVTLALGMGASAAVFSLLDAVYFRPLPIREPESLVDVSLSSTRTTAGLLSYREIQRIRASATAFEDVVAIGQRGATLRQDDTTELLRIDYVSGNYFDALGVPMSLGRGLHPEDDGPRAASPVVVIHDRLWRERLGARPDVVGSAIRLNDTLFTVVGVTAPGYQGLTRGDRTDVWVTASQAPFVVAGLRQELEAPFQPWFRAVARLGRGRSLDEARVELETVLERFRSDAPEQYREASIVARTYRETYRAAALEGGRFLALVGLALFVALANVANLALARSESRRRDVAIQAALGASRSRLARAAFTESSVLSLFGAVGGVLIGSWMTEAFEALVPPGALTYDLDVRFDHRVFLFTASLAILSALVVGLISAWGGGRADIAASLKEAAVRGAHFRQRITIRDLIVAGQLSLCVVVLIAAGMLFRSFVHGSNINPGFDTRKNVVTFYLVPGLRGYDAPRTYRFFEQCRESARALPSVKRASYAIRLPAQANEAGWAYDFTIPGKEPPSGEPFFRIKYTMVGPDYFDVMGTRILRGRGIQESDRPDGAPVAVINETMARTIWPGEDPVGKRILMGRNDPVSRAIVGVAEDNKIANLYEPQEMYVYVPYAQHPRGFGLLLVEVSGEGASVIGAVRKRIAELDAAQPILDVGDFARHMDLVLFEERRDAWIASGIALLAVLLGAVGIHGVLAWTVVRRTREIGIRLAVGACPADILRMVLGRGLRLTATGLVLGVTFGLVAGRLLESRLHGVSRTDGWSFILGAAILLAAAVVASLIPAWRAARANAVVALRCE